MSRGRGCRLEAPDEEERGEWTWRDRGGSRLKGRSDGLQSARQGGRDRWGETALWWPLCGGGGLGCECECGWRCEGRSCVKESRDRLRVYVHGAEGADVMASIVCRQRAAIAGGRDGGGRV